MIGVIDSKKLLEDIPNKIRDILGIIVDVNLLTQDGKDYIEICVNPSSYPVNFKGEYHYRSGSTKHLGLIENGKLKRAAILLFHRNPEKWVTGAYIKIGYFGEGSDLRYQDEIHGSLFMQAERVIELIYLKYTDQDS